MVYQYVTKVYRQHGTLVTSVPMHVRQVLEINNKSHLIWAIEEDSRVAQIGTVEMKDKVYGRDTRNSDKKD